MARPLGNEFVLLNTASTMKARGLDFRALMKRRITWVVRLLQSRLLDSVFDPQIRECYVFEQNTSLHVAKVWYKDRHLIE